MTNYEVIICTFCSIDVPLCVLMNKVDRLQATLADDISKLFHSVEVKKKLDDIATSLGVPEMRVLPMSNYHYEVVPNMNKDILALANLKIIMDSAKDSVNYACTTDAPPGFYQ